MPAKFYNWTSWLILIFTTFYIGIHGLIVYSNDDSFKAVNKKLYEDIHYLFVYRIIFMSVYAVGILLICFAICFILYSEKREHDEHFNRVPLLKKYLEKRSKQYDETGKEADTCAICLGEF